MQTLTTSSGSLVRGVAPTHRPVWPVTFLVIGAIAILGLVATISVWFATPDSSPTTPTRTIQSTTAAEVTLAPAAPVAVGHTAHVPPTPHIEAPLVRPFIHRA